MSYCGKNEKDRQGQVYSACERVVKPINQRPALAQGFPKYAALELDFC